MVIKACTRFDVNVPFLLEGLSEGAWNTRAIHWKVYHYLHPPISSSRWSKGELIFQKSLTTVHQKLRYPEIVRIE